MIRSNLLQVLEKIEKARVFYKQTETIKLVAVSKYSTTQDVLEAYEASQISFGENKVQDLKKKALELKHLNLEWHFIGTLQKNKINALLALRPALIHSLYSLKLAHALQERLERQQMKLQALLQVNSSKEDSKSGFTLEEAYDCYIQIQETCPNIMLMGIMCMGANTDDRMQITQGFENTQKLFSRLGTYNAKILSMGMSNDYEIAIACGSNCLRIGSEIFKKL